MYHQFYHRSLCITCMGSKVWLTCKWLLVNPNVKLDLSSLWFAREGIHPPLTPTHLGCQGGTLVQLSSRSPSPSPSTFLGQLQKPDMCKDYIILPVGSIQENMIIIDARYMYSISEYQGLGLVMTLHHRLIRWTKSIWYMCTHVYSCIEYHS